MPLRFAPAPVRVLLRRSMMRGLGGALLPSGDDSRRRSVSDLGSRPGVSTLWRERWLGRRGNCGRDSTLPLPRDAPAMTSFRGGEMDKGDAFIMLASAYHGGGNNTTKDERRLMFATFSVRGYMRQEENQYLAVPQEVAKKFDRDIQEFMGYSMSDPAGGFVEEMDPIFVLRPEEAKGPTDF